MTTISLIQNCATAEVTDNLAILDALIERAAANNPDLVLLPEAFAFIGPARIKLTIAEPLPHGGSPGGPILERCRQWAERLDCDLILGGFHEALPDTASKTANTCVHLAANGDVVATYRKIHMFDVALSDGTQLTESANTFAGESLVTTDLLCGTLGLSICYDLRFPTFYQALVDLGARFICVPSAFTATTGAAHWHTLLRARAIETQCFVLAPAQYGQHNKHRRSYGHSLIVDPWGEILAEGPAGEAAVVTANIDPQRVDQVRTELPSLTHRRNFKRDTGGDDS